MQNAERLSKEFTIEYADGNVERIKTEVQQNLKINGIPLKSYIDAKGQEVYHNKVKGRFSDIETTGKIIASLTKFHDQFAHLILLIDS